MSWTSSQTMTITPPATWEELRKRARHLENEIDAKLISLNKIGISLGGSSSRFDTSFTGNSDKSHGYGTGSTPQTAFEALTRELSDGINRLKTINEQMAHLVDTSGGVPGAALRHTLQRHLSILHDYETEFHKTRQNIQNRIERDQLLMAPATSSSGPSSTFLNSNDGFLKENEHIRSSDRLLDEQISIAIEAKDRVMSQRHNLKDIGKKINALTKRYPALNSLMQKIQMKKRRDTLILAGVIAVCLILLFLWTMG